MKLLVIYILFSSLILSLSLLNNKILRINNNINCKIVSNMNTIMYLNRIFVDINECYSNPNNDEMLLDLKEDDYRCQHIKNILKLNTGDSLRCGIVDIGMNNECYIIKNDKNNGISINLGNIKDMNTNKLSCSVDLVLAVPRPLRLERLLPVISCIGVSNLILTGGEKVEKDYFGSHLFRNPDKMNKCLIEGLEQAEVDFSLPKVFVRRDLNKFLTIDEGEMFPSSSYYKFIAHPFKAGDIIPMRMKQYKQNDNNDNKKKIVIAVGPEGGFTTDEVIAFIRNGYNLINIGDRILRTDMAVPVLLGLAHEFIST